MEKEKPIFIFNDMDVLINAPDFNQGEIDEVLGFVYTAIKWGNYHFHESPHKADRTYSIGVDNYKDPSFDAYFTILSDGIIHIWLEWRDGIFFSMSVHNSHPYFEKIKSPLTSIFTEMSSLVNGLNSHDFL